MRLTNTGTGFGGGFGVHDLRLSTDNVIDDADPVVGIFGLPTPAGGETV